MYDFLEEVNPSLADYYFGKMINDYGKVLYGYY